MKRKPPKGWTWLRSAPHLQCDRCGYPTDGDEGIWANDRGEYACSHACIRFLDALDARARAYARARIEVRP